MAKRKSEPKTEADFLEQEKAEDRARAKANASLALAASESNAAAGAVGSSPYPQPDKGGRVTCWDPLSLNGRGSYRVMPATDAYAGLRAGTLLARCPVGEPHPVLDKKPEETPKPPKHTPKPDAAPGSVPVHNAPDED